MERLKALHLAHLRVDLKLWETDCPMTLRRAAAEASALGIGLEAAVFVTNNAEAELKGLAELLGSVQPRVCRWAIFHVAEKSTTEPWVKLAREHLQAFDPSAKIGSGTNANFTELNRGRPPLQWLDFVCYSINPQVHAFDNSSLVETLEGHVAAIESARQFIGDRALAITPITLKPGSIRMPPAPSRNRCRENCRPRLMCGRCRCSARAGLWAASSMCRNAA